MSPTSGPGRAEETRAWTADVVRSGLWDAEEVLRQVVEAVAEDLPDLDAGATAQRWIAEAWSDWRADAATWPAVTDHDRLVEVFARLEAAGIPVLQGCTDHWDARDRLREGSHRGIAWFTPPDVWHAIGEGMLEVNLWHGSGANVAPGDALLEESVVAFADAGLAAHFDEGRIEVAAYWQRRPPLVSGV